MEKQAFAKKYGLDLMEVDQIIIYHTEEAVADALVFFPNKQEFEIGQLVEEFVSIVPKKEIANIEALYPHAQVHIAKKQKEIIAIDFENKQKYLQVEVLLKDDKFVVVPSHGGWDYIKKHGKTLGEQMEIEKAERLAKELKIKENAQTAPKDPLFKKYNKVIKVAENVVFKRPSRVKSINKENFEK